MDIFPACVARGRISQPRQQVGFASPLHPFRQVVGVDDDDRAKPHQAPGGVVADDYHAACLRAGWRRLDGFLHDFLGFSMCFEGEFAHCQALHPQYEQRDPDRQE